MLTNDLTERFHQEAEPMAGHVGDGLEPEAPLLEE